MMADRKWKGYSKFDRIHVCSIVIMKIVRFVFTLGDQTHFSIAYA